MKLILIVIGKTTDLHVQAMIDDYSRRLQHYVPFSLTCRSASRSSPNSKPPSL